MKKERGYTVVEILVVILLLAGVGGWIANIYKMAQIMGDALTGWFLLRLAGVFVPPLGAVLGFI